MADEIRTAFRTTFRDYSTEGVPSSGRHKVKKSDGRNLGDVIQDAFDGIQQGYSADYETRAQLYADLNHPAGSLGRVFGDSNAAYIGVYKKSGASGSGSWTRIGSLPEDTTAIEAQVETLEDGLTSVSTEVITARGGAATLDVRLDETDSAISAVTSDLAEEVEDRTALIDTIDDPDTIILMTALRQVIGRFGANGEIATRFLNILAGGGDEIGLSNALRQYGISVSAAGLSLGGARGIHGQDGRKLSRYNRRDAINQSRRHHCFTMRAHRL